MTASPISPSASARALGLSGNEEPLFVLKLDAAKARVVVGPRAALASLQPSC